MMSLSQTSAPSSFFLVFRLALLIALLSVVVAPATAAECSATQPCPIGCCSKWGNCGLGPDYCAPTNCIASCGAKSECDPGGWGLTYANATACPLNVCCSAYGFCGTTHEFCGTPTVAAPACDVASTSIKRVVGYYEAWATTERPCNAMYPGQIPQGIYTHVNFAFASIDPVTFTVVPAASTDSDLYQRLQAIKTRDLGLQTWIAIGGAANQEAFFASLLQFMQTWGFTAVDIDWEYPEAPDRSGRGEDFANFPVFLQQLRGALNAYGFGLSVTLPSSYWYLQHFDLPRLQPWVDWFNVMEYDLHGTWDIGNQWAGAFLNAHTNLTEIRDSFDLLWRNNVDPAKINLGLAMYGRSTNGGQRGLHGTRLEIEDIIAANGLSPTLYADAAVKTISWGDNQWVSFDDADTWKIKATMPSRCASAASWCGPLATTYAAQLAGALGRTVFIDPATNVTAVVTSSFSQVDTCQWSNCGAGCPAGFAEVQLSTDPLGGSLTDATGCFGGSVHRFRYPKTAPLPVCVLRGFQDSGVCNPGCAAGEAEVGAVDGMRRGIPVGVLHGGKQQQHGTIRRVCVVWCAAAVLGLRVRGGVSQQPPQLRGLVDERPGRRGLLLGRRHELLLCRDGELLVARQQGACALGSAAYCCKGPSVTVVGGLGGIGNLGLRVGLTTVGGADANLAVLADTDLENKTAVLLRQCLQEHFLDPTCPPLWASSIDEQLYGTISRRGIIGVNQYYNYICVTEIMSVEIVSPSPSELIAFEWNGFQSQTGVGYNQLREYVMPFNDGEL
ncbi:hypothetical protein SCUCBS95973_007682 [Sporothrix curviconia]|uniref:chitinase n=1 Tax=Sporothrix curviconia TaxID=1260050 RepID=A0ABP0CI65_9PEZI